MWQDPHAAFQPSFSFADGMLLFLLIFCGFQGAQGGVAIEWSDQLILEQLRARDSMLGAFQWEYLRESERPGEGLLTSRVSSAWQSPGRSVRTELLNAGVESEVVAVDDGSTVSILTIRSGEDFRANVYPTLEVNSQDRSAFYSQDLFAFCGIRPFGKLLSHWMSVAEFHCVPVENDPRVVVIHRPFGNDPDSPVVRYFFERESMLATRVELLVLA